jgi:hypothetical protein
MPYTKDTTQTATAYPTVEQYQRWKARADELDMSMSEFIQSMTEAGMKKFERDIPDEDFTRVRKRRDEYRQEVKQKRARVEELEQALNRTMRGDIERFIQANPGVNVQEIIQHIINDVPKRVQEHLQDMEGSGNVTKEDGQYYFNAES